LRKKRVRGQKKSRRGWKTEEEDGGDQERGRETSTDLNRGWERATVRRGPWWERLMVGEE
jgi:hypothetical protein